MRKSENALLPDWYTLIKPEGVQTDLPGIYEWRIDNTAVYIGKYGRIRRPTKEYARNLARMLNKKPYRKSNEDGFRLIHRELHDAHHRGAKITLTILENVTDPKRRGARERELIAQRRQEETSGGPRILNSD